MRRLDLRKDAEQLDDLAPFKVLAVMSQPSDTRRREQMLALLHAQTGHGRSRRRALTEDGFLREEKLMSRRGSPLAIC